MGLETTVVLDAGARYGMHPSWNGFGGDLSYFAFEPDQAEAERLQRQVNHLGYRVIQTALAHEKGTQTLHITKHRGYCSFLKPDLESEWFKRCRPGEADIEKTVQVATEKVDDFAQEQDVCIDFFKIDTEGTELDVLIGADHQITENGLGIRTSAYFQACYQNQPLFQDVQAFLTQRGYFLLNLDYVGFGTPRNFLFRKPDPSSPESARYGTLIATDGVWIKNYEAVGKQFANDSEQFAYTTLKYAYFCLLNDAADVGIDTLLSFLQDYNGHFGGQVVQSLLYRSLMKACAQLMGQWRVYPDAQWHSVRDMFRTIFGFELESGSNYWEQIQSL